MKKLIVFSSIAGFFFIACKKAESRSSIINPTGIVHTPEKPVTDYVIIKSSIKISDSLCYTYFSKVLYFSYIHDKKLLSDIYFKYKGLKTFSKKELKIFLEKEKTDYYKQLNEDTRGWAFDNDSQRKWYFKSDMKLRSNLNSYMHIQYFESEFKGGAHANYNFTERIFDLKNKRKLILKDITSLPTEHVSKILMKNINKINSKGKMKNSEMLSVKVIPVTDNFYFDDKNLYFNYNPYEIAAFGAGNIIIPISWKELRGSLSPEFKNRMGLNNF
jgi:hypothetical protein